MRQSARERADTLVSIGAGTDSSWGPDKDRKTSMKKTAPIAFAGCELADGEDLAHRKRLAAAGIDLHEAEQVGQYLQELRERRPPPLS